MKATRIYIKNPAQAYLRNIVASLLLCIGITESLAQPSGSLYWDPTGAADQNTGGPGTWDASAHSWWTGSGSTAWLTGEAGSIAQYNSLYFGGAGQSAPYEITTALTSIQAPSSLGTYWINLYFNGNYAFKSIASSMSTIGGTGDNVYVNISSASGKTLAFDGGANGLTILSEAANSTQPSLRFTGGGEIILRNNTHVRTANTNGRLTIGDIAAGFTRLVLDDSTVSISGTGSGSSARYPRIMIDHGEILVKGGTISSYPGRSQSEHSAIQIGNAKAPAPSSLVIKGGEVSAMGYNDGYGVLFGSYTANVGNAGGTLKLDGGILYTTSIVSLDTTGSTTAQLIFNGGTIALLNGSQTGRGNHLDNFIRGFGGSENKFVRIDAGGAFVDTTNASNNGTSTISATMSGVGGFTKLGSKSLKLTAANTYSGATTVSGGALELAAANAIASSSSVRVAAGTQLNSVNFSQTLNNLSGAGLVAIGTGDLTLVNSTTSIFSGSITRASPAALAKNGAGVFVLGAGANLGGGITINDGGVQGVSAILASAFGSGSIDTGANGRVIFDEAADASFTGVINGTGKIEKIGEGTLTLNSSQNYTGGVIAASGVLRGNTASLRGNITNNAIVVFDQGSAGTFSGTFSGTGTFEKTGAATLTLASASRHTGATRITEGALAATAADVLASSSHTHIESAGTFDFGGLNQTLNNLSGSGTLLMGPGNLTAHSANNTTDSFAGIINGAGNLTKTGDGSLLLTGANTYTGSTLVNAGGLFVDNAVAQLAGEITVAAHATFGGAGTIGSTGKTLILLGDSTLQIGTPSSLVAQTLTVNSNITFSSAILGIDLFSDNVSDRLLLGSGATLTASGGNTIDIGNFTSGTFNIGNIAILKADSTSLTITLRGQSAEGGRQSIASGTNSAGDLILTTIASKSREMAWTGSVSALWNTADTDWNDNITPGDANQFASGDRAIFDSVSDSGNTANRNITIEGSYVMVSDMVVRGGANYSFGGAAIIADAGSVIDIAGTLTDATGKLIMQGTGTLTLANSGTNQFKGGVELHSGMLALDSLGALGDSSVFVVGDAAASVTVRIETNANNINLDGDMDLGTKGLIFDTQANNATIAGVLSGTAGASLVKIGTGTLTLGAANSYLGTTDIREGTLHAVAEYAFAQSETVALAAGAILDLDNFSQRANNLGGAGLITFGTSSETLFFATNTSETTFSGTTTGAGSFVKNGSATLTFDGNATLGHTGTTAVLEGKLWLNSANALATSAAVVIDTAGTLDTNGQNQTLQNLQGSGTLVHGTGTLTLESTQDSAFLGTLVANASGNTGSLVKTGTATLTLGGDNDFAGGTSITSGTIVAKSIRALGSGPITLTAARASLRFDGASGELAQSITGATSEIDFSGGSRVRLSGANTIAGIRAFGANTHVIAAHQNALGGSAASVVISDNAMLEVAVPRLRAGNVSISGGALLFAVDQYGAPSQNFTVNSLSLKNRSLIAFGGPVATGRYYLVNGSTANSITLGKRGTDYLYNSVQYGVQIEIDEYGELIAFNQAINPSKDIAAAFDGMVASMNAIHSHISEGFLMPLMERTLNDRSRNFWFKAIGSFADYENNATTPGHRDNTWGGLAGYDYVSADNRRMMGTYVGMGTTQIDCTGSAAVDGEQQFAGIYASSHIGSIMYVGASFGGAWMDSNTERSEGPSKAVGHYDIDSITASLELGGVFRPWDTGAIRPSAALHYMNARFKNHTEGGAGAVIMDDFSQDVWQSLLSLQAHQEYKLPWGWTGIVDVMLGWRHILSGNGCPLSGRLAADKSVAFALQSDGYNRGSAVIGAGTRFSVSEHIILGLGYEYEVAGDMQRHTVNGSVRITW